mmetsp:Transcript_20111/g.41029  ORF Transcript_20111/g.41029 Transcript_20111/m.41029 type:complete len:159 (-) Transcript_20111:184-660(-)
MNDLQRRQVEETQYREERSKSSWAMQHAEAEAGRITVFHIDDMKHARLHTLKEQVADLCDMQPTPANMLRAPRKELLSDLKKELAVALADVESELDAMGGSVSDMTSLKSGKTGKSTAMSVATAKSAATTKSVVRPNSAASSTKSVASRKSAAPSAAP